MDDQQPEQQSEQQLDQQQVEQLDQAVGDNLQKAIDDITNTTNVDPVFSDPVAAPSSVPEGDTGELGEPVGPFPVPKVEVVAEDPNQLAPVEGFEVPEIAMPPMPEMPAAPAAPPIEIAPIEVPPAEGLSTHQIKEAALRDLVPLLDRLNMTPTQKFRIYKNVFENLRDYRILEPLYNTTKEMADDAEKAQDLLYLVEAIDKM